MAFQIRYGTEAEWESTNSNIVAGEPAVAVDSGRAFIGIADGEYMELSRVGNIAPAYDASETYNQGDYVMYHGRLYVCNSTITGAWNSAYWRQTTFGEEMEKAALLKHTATLTGNVVNFTNPFNHEIPFASLKVNITATQSGSGDPSPDNVRPISGWDSCTVWDDPVYGGTITWNQLFDYSNLPSDSVLYDTDTYTANNVTFTKNNDGSFSIQTTEEGASANAMVKIGNATKLPTMKTARYIVRGCQGGSASTYYINWGSSTKCYGSGYIGNKMNSNFNFWITVASGTIITTPVKVYPQVYNIEQLFGLEYATELTSLGVGVNKNGNTIFNRLFPDIYYEYNTGEVSCVSKVNGDPYREVSVSFTSADTIYGGTLDLKTGLLSAKWKKVDLGQLTWQTRYTGTINKTLSTTLSSYYLRNSVNVVSEKYVFNGGVTGVSSLGSPDSKDIGLYKYRPANSTSTDHSTTIYIVVGVDDTPSGLMIYTLETPVTYQLTPVEVKALIGQNNVWADAGSVEVTYYTKGE